MDEDGCHFQLVPDGFNTAGTEGQSAQRERNSPSEISDNSGKSSRKRAELKRDGDRPSSCHPCKYPLKRSWPRCSFARECRLTAMRSNEFLESRAVRPSGKAFWLRLRNRVCC